MSYLTLTVIAIVGLLFRLMIQNPLKNDTHGFKVQLISSFIPPHCLHLSVLCIIQFKKSFQLVTLDYLF